MSIILSLGMLTKLITHDLKITDSNFINSIFVDAANTGEIDTQFISPVLTANGGSGIERSIPDWKLRDDWRKKIKENISNIDDILQEKEKNLLFLLKQIGKAADSGQDVYNILEELIKHIIIHGTGENQGFSDHLLQTIYECNEEKFKNAYKYWRDYRTERRELYKNITNLKNAKKKQNKNTGSDTICLDEKIEQLKAEITRLENGFALGIPSNIYRKKANEYFKKICSIGRFEKYWPKESDDTKHYINGINVSLKTSGEKSISFEDILFPPNTNIDQETSSISLCGKGGIGKTFLILRMMETIFKNNKYANIIPLYIALQKIDKNYKGDVFDALLGEITAYCGTDSITKDEFESFLRSNSNKVIIFADGMNEVTGDENRSTLATSLTDMQRIYGCRICVSSRQNHVNMFNRLAGTSHFKDAEVNDLQESQINKYLSDSGCIARYSEIRFETAKLLETAQGLAMYAVLVGKDKSKINSFTSLGGLILAYSDLLLDINRDEISDPSVLEFEKILEEIAYSWVNTSNFSGEVTDKQINAISAKKNIKDIFIKITNTNSTTSIYEFSHQNFRDMYCSRFLARQISKINDDNIETVFNEYFNLSKSLVSDNDEVLELTSAFIEDKVKKAIEILRKAANREEKPLTNYDYPLSRLIRIHAFGYNNNISELDLSNLDLREITVSGYQLYSDNKSKYTIFNEAKISTATFLKNGLDTASSTITKYEYENKTYVVAFARTSIAVIDVAENQVQVVRNLPSNKWVNCCYATEKNGEPVIYLGHENGIISEFYPKVLYLNQRYVKQDLPIKSVGEIFSINGIIVKDEEYIVVSSIQGQQGYLSVYKKYQVGDNKFISISLPDIISLDKYKLDYTNCKMTYSPKAELILVSFIDRIYVYNCKKLFKEQAGKELHLYVDKGFETPYVTTHCGIVSTSEEQLIPVELNIRDIYACDYVENNYVIIRFFVNRCNKIDLFELEVPQNEDNTPDSYKACLLHSYDPANTNDKKAPKANYTKFSEIAIPNSNYINHTTRVLVGISVDKPYDDFHRFYELYCSDAQNKLDIATENVGNKYNGYVTHTGVYYNLKNIKRRFLATVSDYRTIEIDCIGDEEYPKRTYYGAYNGVHYIDTSSDCEKIICGNYDGYVVELEKQILGRGDNRKSKWIVSDAMHHHTKWVWKTLYLNANNNYIVSCSYDGKFILTSKSDTDMQSTCIIKDDKKLFDFCISSNGDKIYVISESGTLHTIESSVSNSNTVTLMLKDSKKIVNNPNSNLRTITIDDYDDHPVLFYNDGKDTLGHIIKYTHDNEHTDFIDLNTDTFKTNIETNGQSVTKYAFIRNMGFVRFDDYKEDWRCLIAVGDLHKKGIVLIAGYDKDGSGDIDQTRMSVYDSITVDGNINDFTITKYKNEYILWLAHKNLRISAYRLIATDGKIKIRNFIMKEKLMQDTSKGNGSHSIENIGDSEKTVIKQTDDQPMCLKAYKNDKVLIGLLNGDVLQASLHYDQNVCQHEFRCLGETVIHLTNVIHTHADLNSIYKVELNNCQIDDKEEFKKQLDAYFKISD